MIRSLSRIFTRAGTIALAAAALLAGGGCAAVRPVTLTPSPEVVTAAYVTEAKAEPAPAPPDGLFTPPPAQGGTPLPDAADATRSPAKGAGAGGNLWWTAFGDPALDGAIQEALHHNYFVRDLRNLIYENQLDPAMPKGILWPLQIGAPASIQHAALSAPPALGQPGYGFAYTQTDLGLTATYQVDVWGQLDVQRRTFEDLVEQQRQNTESFAHILADQVAQTWFEILEQRALRALLESQVRYNQELLEIVKARFEQHLAPRLAVLQQEQQLLGTQAQVPLIVAQLALSSSKLTALLGRVPTPDAALVPGDRRLPELPPAPAVGAPADLVRNSPELRGAQARVAEAEHLKSQNLASWLPVVEIVGGVGTRSYDFSQTFTTGSVGARLTWPIFDGGQRITRAQQLELTVERRNWQYQLAYNTAIGRVQDTLIQERKQADHVRTVRDQVDLARRVLAEARQLFEQGMSDYLPVLAALGSLTTLERSAVQAQRLLLSYRIQLYHALGGTWSSATAKLTH